MASAFRSLRSGIDADIRIMAEHDFIGVDPSLINEIYTTMRITKIAKNTMSPIHWIEAWRLYGLHNYGKINTFLEKQLHPKQRTLININRGKSTEEKIIALKKYVAPPPALMKKVEETITPNFNNEYASPSYA